MVAAAGPPHRLTPRRRAQCLGLRVRPTCWSVPPAMRWSDLTRYCPTGRETPVRLRALMAPKATKPRAAKPQATKRKSLIMSLTIGVDVGGTKIAAGVVDEKGSIVEMVRRPTPAANASATVDVLSEAVCELLTRHDVEAGGIRPAALLGQRR